MTREAVQNALHAQPFKPFSLRLTDGSLVRVPHPEFIIVTQDGRTAVVNSEGGRLSILDLGLVTAIEFNSPSAK
jgi:hypothetical protein